MQCKDIPDEPILRFLAALGYRSGNYFKGSDRDVSLAMPYGVDESLLLAKMRQLIKRGLAGGCCCGCRGDFEITDKGREFLELRPHPVKLPH